MLTLDHWQQQGCYFDYKSHQIFYRVEGSAEKPTLLLIHGFPTCSWDWHALWHDLIPHFQVVTLDLIGFGFSDKPRRYAYSISDQAQICLALLRHLHIDHCHLLAHDYGDTVAQEIMALAQEENGSYLGSVLLLNGGLFPETHHALLVQKLLMSPVGGLISRLMNFKKFKQSLDKVCVVKLSDQEIGHYWALINRSNGAAVFPKLIRYMQERRENRARWVGALQNTTTPIGLINGIDDPISGGHMVARYREIVSTDGIAALPGIGHYPQLEAPAQVLSAALTFWRDNGVIVDR